MLPHLELAYDTTTHSSTHCGPFKVILYAFDETNRDLDFLGDCAHTFSSPLSRLFLWVEQKHRVIPYELTTSAQAANVEKLSTRLGIELLQSSEVASLNLRCTFEPLVRWNFGTYERTISVTSI